MDAENLAPLVEIAKAEAVKVAPFAGTLLVYGLTLQQWTLLFGCLYAAGMFLDLVVRRWLAPLVRFVLARRRDAKAGTP